MEATPTSLIDNSTKFLSSLNELREFRSQLHNAADYWKSSFLKSQDKKLIIESSKEYISEALLITIDHLGCLSVNLQSCLSSTNSVPETQHKIQTLKQRIGGWQNYSYKLGLPTKSTAQFSRHHCRYISLPLSLKDSKVPNGESSGSCIDAKETDQLNYLHTLLPVEDSLSIVPKSEYSTFQFQKAQKPKRRPMNWKRMRRTEIASVIKRTRRILT